MSGNPRDNKAASERKPGDGYVLKVRWHSVRGGDWNELWFRDRDDVQAFCRLFIQCGFIVEAPAS